MYLSNQMVIGADKKLYKTGYTWDGKMISANGKYITGYGTSTHICDKNGTTILRENEEISDETIKINFNRFKNELREKKETVKSKVELLRSKKAIINYDDIVCRVGKTNLPIYSTSKEDTFVIVDKETNTLHQTFSSDYFCGKINNRDELLLLLAKSRRKFVLEDGRTVKSVYGKNKNKKKVM